MIRILAVGQCGIELDGKRLSAESEVVFGVLLYLAARSGELVPRQELQSMFWPDISATRGRHCLRQVAYRLRQLGVCLESSSDSLGIRDADLQFDFSPLLEQTPAHSVYQNSAIGDIFRGYQPTFSTPFARWLEDYRSRIAFRLRQSLVKAIVDLRTKGRYREAEPLARVCLQTDPLNELATLTLAESAAVLSGNRAEAMAILDRYIEELGETREKKLALAALILRRRISERFLEQRYAVPDPPFVGREELLEFLVEKLHEASAGRGGTCFLWGEPGIGKTRLLDELTKIAHIQGVRVQRLAASPNDRERPLALFSSLLPQMLAMPGAIGISSGAFDAIRQFVQPQSYETDPPNDGASAANTFQELKNGIRELFETLSEEHVSGYFVDDIQWADARSLEVLTDVIERCRHHRIAFVITSRIACTSLAPSPIAVLCSRAAVRQLTGLKASEVERLLSAIAEQRSFALSSAFVEKTIETSAGNPFFVSELTSHYVWNGLTSDLPHNMQTLLQTRLQSLSGDALLVFQTCAALGDQASVDRIAATLQIPTYRLLRAIEELQAASLLTCYAQRIQCRHELLSEEALKMLSIIARQTLYRKVAVILERAAVEEMNTATCWHAVHCWIQADELNRASQHVKTMASRLVRCGLVLDADQLVEKARAVITQTPLLVELIPVQLQAARARGELTRSLELAEECKRLSQTGTSNNREAQLAEFAAFDASRGIQGLPPDADLDLRRLQRSEESPDVLLELALRIIITADDSLDFEIAAQCFKIVTRRRLLDSVKPERREIFDLVFHSHFGRLDVAVQRAMDIVFPSRAGSRRDQSTKARTLRWAHRPLFIEGRFGDALVALDKSITAARSFGSTHDEVASTAFRIDVLIAANRLDEALDSLRCMAIGQDKTIGRLVETTTIGSRAELCFALGNFGDLENILSLVDSLSCSREPTRTRMGIDALQILLAMSRRLPARDDRTGRLLNSWNAFSKMGGADTAFMALVIAFVVNGQEASASQICEAYRACRREKWLIPDALRAQFEAILGAWNHQLPTPMLAFFQ